MFCNSGYVSLAEIYRDARDWSDEDTPKLTQLDIMSFAFRQPGFSLCTPQGGTVFLARHAFYREKPVRNRFLGFHPAIDIVTFTISKHQLERYTEIASERLDETQAKLDREPTPRLSSGASVPFLKALSDFAAIAKIRDTFAHLDGCSPQILNKYRPSSIEEIISENEASSPSEMRGEREIINEIVSLAKSDTSLKRDEIRSLVCPGMKTDAWRAVWRVAANLHPELSKPGPRRS
ncbi:MULTISPECIES: hypothetical protein [Thioclava]|uniref:hypothetical protein n=1 Tax=Thioclava TaxID=285107 RepID=UPI0011BAE257|nr:MULTISPECIES: hypothetical protein [Thioclava]